MRKRGKVDANHPEIMGKLRDLMPYGVTVRSLAAVGDGMPDLIVGHRGANFLIEIKDGDASPSRRKLTFEQVIFHASWQGQVAVALSFADVLNVIRFQR